MTGIAPKRSAGWAPRTKLLRFEEAEPLLLAGYELLLWMQEKIAPPDRVVITQAAERITQLYAVWSPPDKAAVWRQRLASVESAFGTRDR
jgi:hypothetical protein